MSILATAGALNQIVAGVQRAADKPNDLSPSAIVSSAPDIKAEVAKSLGSTPSTMTGGKTLAIVETENPLFSPTVIASVIGVIASVATLMGYTGINDPAVQLQLVTGITAVVGLFVTIRKLVSKKVSTTAVSKP